MILLMTKEGEEPTEAILQSSRWMAFAGKFFISGSFSVSNFPFFLLLDGAMEQSMKISLGRVHLYCRIIPNKCPNSWSWTWVTWWWSWWYHCTIYSHFTGTYGTAAVLPPLRTTHKTDILILSVTINLETRSSKSCFQVHSDV